MIRDGIVVYRPYGDSPLLVFPCERGNRFEWENTGMIGALAPAGSRRAVLRSTASTPGTGTPPPDDSIPVEDRARRHNAYEQWIHSHVVPWIHHDCSGPIGMA